MGLSRDGNSITTYQVLLDIATNLQELVSNPKALEEAAALSYALPEFEQKKAAEAKDAIAKNSGILSDIEKANAKLLETKKQADDATAKSLAAANALSEKEADLASREQALRDAAKRQNEAVATIAASNAALVKREDALAKAEADLAKKIEEISIYEDSLKTRAAQFKELTAGL